MNAARHICTRVGCGLVLVHHFRKQGGAYGDSSNRLRGSTDLYASVDSLVTVETRGVRKVKVSGQHRAAPPTDAMWFMATDVEGSVCFEQTTKTPHSEEQQILAAVLDGGPAGLTKTQAIKGASIKQEVGSAAFDALVSKGQLKPAPGQGKKVRGVRYCAVDIGDEVDELCAELAESQDPSEELE